MHTSPTTNGGSAKPLQSIGRAQRDQCPHHPQSHGDWLVKCWALTQTQRNQCQTSCRQMDIPCEASVPTGDETTAKRAAKDRSMNMADGPKYLTNTAESLSEVKTRSIVSRGPDATGTITRSGLSRPPPQKRRTLYRPEYQPLTAYMRTVNAKPPGLMAWYQLGYAKTASGETQNVRQTHPASSPTHHHA